MIVDNRMMARVTSYEIVCATARRAPIRHTWSLMLIRIRVESRQLGLIWLGEIVVLG